MEDYKDKYNSLEDDYKELVRNYTGFKDTVVEALENLKGDDYCDYDVGYNTAIEHCIAAVTDMNVPFILDTEYKPPFLVSRLEYELLKYWGKKFKYIARDKGRALYIYQEKPSKNEEVWGSYYGHSMLQRHFDDLFDFVDWEDEEPMNIEELLNNCEVVDDD